MIEHDMARDVWDRDCVACRIDAACELLTTHADLASAVTLVGIPNCGETLAAVQRDHRVWPVEIAVHPQPSRPQAVDVVIGAWPVPELAPVRPLHPQSSIVGRARSWVRHALRRSVRHLERPV